MIEIIAKGDTIIFNFPLSIFNSAAKGCPINPNLRDIVTEIPLLFGYTLDKQRRKGAIIMIAMNQELFEKLAISAEAPVLVEFSADWCVYCRRIGPAMEKIAGQFKNILPVAQVNIDLEPALADREQIEVVPTLVIYHKGHALGSIVAPSSKAQIEEFIRDTLDL